MADRATTILAIDPGTLESAFVLFTGSVIPCAEIVPNDELLTRLWHGFPRLANVVCGIEMIGHYGKGMPAGKEVFDTVLWIGRFYEAWRRSHGFSPELIMRGAVKIHHCNSARAKDPNVRQALIDKYGKPGTKREPGITYQLKSHLWQAFAVASYMAERSIVEQGAA